MDDGTMKKTGHGKRSILISWIISYMAILLIPIVASLFVYIGTGSVIEQEINRANTAILKQVVQVIDNSLWEIQRFSTELAINDKIKSISTVKKPLTYSDRYLISEVVRYEMNKGLMSGLFKAHYVYFKSGDFVLRNNAYYEPNVAWNDFHGKSSLSYDDWYDMVKGDNRNVIRSLGVSKEYSAEGHSLAFVQSILSGAYSGASLVVLLDNAYIQTLIDNMEWIRDGHFFIMDENDEILLTTSKANVISGLKYAELDGNGALFDYRWEDTEWVVSYASSTVNRWKYVSVFPVNVFMEKAAYVRKVTVTGLLSCMVLGAAMALYFARKNYNPVNELVGVLKSRTTQPQITSRNEFQFIREVIYNTLSEKETIGRKLDKQSRELRRTFLSRLLLGRVSPLSLEEMLHSYDVHFEEGRLAVLLFNIEDYRGFFTEEDVEPEEEKLGLVEFTISNVVEELAKQSHSCEIVDVNGMIACIAVLRNVGLEEGKKELLRIARETRDFHKENLYIYITISISGLHQTPAELPLAYQEAMEAIEYRMIAGCGQIISFDDIPSAEGVYHYSLEVERQLASAIKSGDSDKSKSIVNNIFNTNLEQKSLPPELVRCLMFDVSATVMKTLYEFNESPEDELWQLADPVKNLLRHKTVQEMRAGLNEILERVCTHIDSKKGSHNTRLKDDIIAFIQANYWDMNLGNASIAETFHLNPAYLSRFFREQTGEGIPDFISRVRLKAAKEMLKKQKGNIGEIANKVGYSNSVTLIRAFKKYEGITPGKYKDNQSESTNE